MKVLILTATYPPLSASGHDERCRQVTGELVARGHRVQVLTSNHRLPPVGVAGETGVFRELILVRNAAAGIKGGKNYAGSAAFAEENMIALYFRIKRLVPDVVFVWNMHEVLKSLLFKLQARGVPLVYDLHSNWLETASFDEDPWQAWWRRNQSLRTRGYRSLLKLVGVRRRIERQFPVRSSESICLQHAYACSRSLLEDLERSSGVDTSGIPVLYPAVDASKLKIKKRYRPGGRRFMWAGRLSEGKRPLLALDAVARLRGKGVDVSLDYFGLGEPSERKALRNRIADSGMEDRVHMIGIRPGELQTRYADYDAILFTSDCRDPFPITPIEAMLSGLPAILAEDGGIGEIVEDGVHVSLFQAGDVEALTTAMERFIALPDGGAAMARACRTHLETHHGFEKTMDSIEAILETARQLG